MSNAVLTIEDIEKTIKETTKYKDQVETEYFRVLGKLQLLQQQVVMLQEKEERMKKQEETKTPDNTEAKA
jgi:hypothetical protein